MHSSLSSLLAVLTVVSGLDLAKRGSADDATDPAKVLAWLHDNVDLEPNKGVFYSGNTVGLPMARAFCNENEIDGYKFFYTIFDQDFSDAFGGADPSADTHIAAACSETMADFVKGEVRVFNDAGAKSDSFWKTIELPGLNDNKDVTHIWNMEDNTHDPADHDKDLKKTADGLGYAPGWCGVHVIHYQKNEGPAATSNGGSGTFNYRFDITVYDSKKVQIRQVLGADAPGVVGVGVTSALLQVLLVTAGNVDSDPVKFAYGAQSWDSSSSDSVGAYDNGSRSMDFGFSCPAPGGSSSDI